MSKKVLFLIITICILIASCSECGAYNESEHKAFNLWIMDHSVGGFDLDAYIRHNLGLYRGIKEKSIQCVTNFGWLTIIDSKSPQELIAQGGIEEDSPFWRCINHFHDPLIPWDEAGLETTPDIALDSESSILWAQKAKGEQSWRKGGNYSWHDARDYFYRALTGTDSYQRNHDLYSAFLAIGHLMHLIQDSSCPEHVRDDSHGIDKSVYENLLSKYHNGTLKSENDLFQNWLQSGQTLYYPFTDSLTPASILNLDSLPYNARIPIARIVDTDRYTGDNPDVTLNPLIGLAEYTNANFLSQGTIFDGYYYPSKDSSITKEQYVIVDPRDNAETKTREYYKKTGDGATGYRLSTASITGAYQADLADPIKIFRVSALDDSVLEDYASQLVPRAEAYSAQLLRYFFRGTMEISLPSTGVYAFSSTEPADPRYQGFRKVFLLARNTTGTGEEMQGGKIELVIHYRVLTRDPYAVDPRQGALDPFAEYEEAALPDLSKSMYIVRELDDGNSHHISRNAPTLLEFDLGSEEIPLWAVDLTFQVIYRGKLGGLGNLGSVEEDAVCIGYKNVNEPSPLDIINDTDSICVNGEWRTVSTVPDISPKIVESLYLRFSPMNSPQDASPDDGSHIYQIDDLEPGEFKRVYLISDDNYSESVHYVYHYLGEDDESQETEPAYPRGSIRNGYEYDEADDALIRYYPIYRNFRNIQYWQLYYFYNHQHICTDPCPDYCEYEDNPYDLELIN